MTANAAEIASDMSKVKSVVNSSSADMRRAFGIVGNVINNATGGIFTLRGALTAIASGALLQTALRFIEFGKEVGDTAEKLDVSAETLQRWRYSAMLSGVEAQGFNAALTKLNQRLGEIKLGQFTESVTEFQIALGLVGLRIEDLRGKSLEQAFNVIADAIGRTSNNARAAAALFELFGRTGTQMTAMFREGSKGINAAGVEAEKFGAILSNETVAKAKEAGDELERLGSIASAAGTKIAAEMLPALRGLREIITSPALHTGLTLLWGGLVAVFNAPTTLPKAAIEFFKDYLDPKRLERAESEMAEMSADVSRMADDLSKGGFKVAKDVVPIDVKGLAQIAKALDDIAFKTRMTDGEFDKLPKGFPELLHSLGALGNQALQTFINTGKLPPEFEKLRVAHANFVEAVRRQDFAKDLAQSVTTGVESAIVEGRRLRDVWLSLLQDIQRAIIRTFLTTPLQNSLTSFLGGTNGPLSGLFSSQIAGAGGWQTTVTPNILGFAHGGIVDSPTLFSSNGGMGVMGEAGKEAIMPLTRGPDGKLGLAGGGASGTINIDARYSDAGVYERILAAIARLEQLRANPVEANIRAARRYPYRRA